MSKNTYLSLILTSVGYKKQTEHTLGGLSDTFQTTGGKVIFAQTTGGLCTIIPFFLTDFSYFLLILKKEKKKKKPKWCCFNTLNGSN